MRYSLRSRFQGTFLGSILGERVPFSVETLPVKSLRWVEMAIAGAESLIELGKFDLDDWHKRQQQEFAHSGSTLDVLPEAILGTLPVALFFHENTIKLRENLLDLTEMWGDDPLIRDGILAVGYAIAQSLGEKLSPVTLIPQIVSFIGETPTGLPQQLSKVNYLLNCQAGLERAQVELIREEKLINMIAMAFYCFLSTVEDFRLSILRATQNNDSLQGLSAITGALSGAYNSTVGIPVTWQILLVEANSAGEGLNRLHQMVKLADVLMAVWSGVYNFASDSSEDTDEDFANIQCFSLLQAIASPRVIR